MKLWRITHRGEGFEVYEIEAETEAEAREQVQHEFPVDTRIEGAEFLGSEVIEEWDE